MTPVLHIGPVFGCRVMIVKGTLTITRAVQAPAQSEAQARQRIAAMLAEVWPGWQITYLSQPRQIGGAL